MRIDQQVHPRGRGHGGGYLGHAQAARLDDLGPAGEGEQGDSDQTFGTGRRDFCPAPFPLSSHLELVPLDKARGQGQHGLQEIAQDQPTPSPSPDEVGELAGEVPPREEQAQGDGDVGCVEGVAVQGGDDEGDGQEDGVACLIGGEAVIVWEGDCVCVFFFSRKGVRSLCG